VVRSAEVSSDLLIADQRVQVDSAPATTLSVKARGRAKSRLAVVVPVYKGEGCLDELYRRLTAVMASMAVSYQLIFVEDCGGDNSWSLIRQLGTADRHVLGVQLSRNFGQHFAITAGLRQANADWIVVMDCDLQDIPEAIPMMYERANDGFDVVMTRRIEKKHELFRKLGSYVWAKSLSFLSKSDIDSRVGTLSIISSKVADAFLTLEDSHRHYLILLRWLGFKSCYCDVEHGERYEGRSSYSYARLISHAVDGMVAQSSRLLLISIFYGLAISALSLLLALAVVYRFVTHPDVVPGWPSVVCVLLFLAGSLHISVGVAGIYLGKTFEQTKKRPLYIIGDTVNL